MRKSAIALGIAVSFTLFSCGGPKKTVLLEGGNAYDLLQQYISKTHAKPGDLRVEIWDGKNLKAYTIPWQSVLTGADYMTLWKERLDKVNAIYKPGLDKEAKANGWDVYVSPAITLKKEANKKPGTCNDKAGSDINLGLQLVTTGDLKGASNQFKKAIQDDKSCPLAYLDLASAYIERKDYDNAIDAAKEGLKNAGENKDLEYALACAYSDDNKLDYALDALKQALKDGFNDPNKLANDPDLQNLRTGKKESFCELLNKYKIAIKYCLI